MVTQVEPDILECEVKWGLERITMNKASGGDGIPVELLQILKDDAVIVLHSICQQIWKTQQWPQDWKRSVFIQIPKKDKAKECSNQELPDVQAGFRKDLKGKKQKGGFLGGPAVKSPPCKVGDTSSDLGLRGSHLPQSI